MKVLVIGSGGREHALAWKMKQSPRVTKVFVAPGSDGMRSHAVPVSLENHDAILSFIQQEYIDLTFVGQEDYLVEGLVDKIETRGYKAFGPGAAAAALEGSKAFAKDFMLQHHIPTAAYGIFHEEIEAFAYLETLQAPYVVKANGLAAGKGSVICHDLDQAQITVRQMLSGEAFGDAGTTVVIEEFMTGEEASFFILTDGQNFVSLPSCQDYKTIGELDTGLNTGGMGACSPAPVITPAIEKIVIRQIVEPTIMGMAKEGSPYRGVLYIGLMIDGERVRVVEYNCRFGDPECQSLMIRLKSDLFTLALATLDGNLSEQNPEWHHEAAACVMLVSQGYPGKYENGKIISGIDALSQEQPQDEKVWRYIFHSGTRLDGSVYRTHGGRVLGVTALGSTLEKALAESYQVVNRIHWDGLTYRRDIGAKGLLHFRDNRPERSVGIVLGSASDLEVAQKATAILKKFGVGYRLWISSAHRSPERTRQFIRESESTGIEVFIAVAGMAAHLPGVVASETTKPVIGVPIVSTLNGLDALLAIVQMPPGVPVATMATDGTVNAAILAIQILSLRYTDLRMQLMLHKIEMEQKIVASQKFAGLESSL